MKKLFIAFFVIMYLTSCKDEKIVDNASGPDTLMTDTITTAKDDGVAVKKELAQLIQKTVHWAESKEGVNLLEVEEKDSIVTGFDLAAHTKNLEKLKATGFFATEFISNYDNIITTLDRKIKSGEFDPWNVYELPTFIFNNDVNPWCMCQDDPGDWNDVKIGIKHLNNGSGNFFYYFGVDEPTSKDYSYSFNAVKENGIWKISYMYGFDYKNSVTKDGELK